MSGSSTARRVVTVLLVYALGAWIVLVGAGWLRPLLALPELFDRLLRLALIGGVPLAVLVAWLYPQMGDSDGATGRSTPSGGRASSSAGRPSESGQGEASTE